MEAFFTAGPGGTGKRKEQIKAQRAAERPWVEKYRPKTVSEVAYQNEVVSVLKTSLKGGDVPHLLFYGPPGTGKTSTILALARELFGPEMMKSRVLELNASDERGIDIVRDKVKNFAKTTIGARPDKSYPCPPFKIIILDEADAMTTAAQSALRRTIEDHAKVTRFCLICNYVSRIIEPLASRCAKFRFKPLNIETQLARIKEIKEKEGVVCPDEVLNKVVELSGGDLRQAITFLQSAHRLRGAAGITVGDLTDIAGVVPDALIADLVAKCGGVSFEELELTVQDLIADGYSANQIIKQLFQTVLEGAIPDAAKAKALERIAQADKALIDGADEYLQIMDVTACIMQILRSG